MRQSEVFVRKFWSAVDGARTGPVTIDEISALDHEIFDLLRVSSRHTGQREAHTTRWNLLPL